MIDIGNIGPVNPKAAEEVERETFKKIRTKAGRAAFISLFGHKGEISKLHQGIKYSENALKWMEEAFKGDEWKGS